MFLHLAHFSKTTKRSERKEGTNAAAARSSSGPRESETTDREGMGHSPLLSCPAKRRAGYSLLSRPLASF